VLVEALQAMKIRGKPGSGRLQTIGAKMASSAIEGAAELHIKSEA
jgi:hypothetical protein